MGDIWAAVIGCSGECRSHRLWKKQDLPDSRSTFLLCFCVRVCVRFVMNSPSRQSALRYLAGIHARGTKLATAEMQQIHLDFNRMCNTRNTSLLSFHLLDVPLARTPANCLQSCSSEVKILSQKCWLFRISKRGVASRVCSRCAG